PKCSANRTTNCFPPFPPFDGDLLQIMPWPIYGNMTDHDIRAIYEYLKAIPCIQGNYPGPAGPGANIPPEPADRCSKRAVLSTRCASLKLLTLLRLCRGWH